MSVTTNGGGMLSRRLACCLLAAATWVPTVGAEESVLAAPLRQESAETVSPQERLLELAGSWIVEDSTFPGSEGGKFVAFPVAGGQGLYSEWKHGADDSAYEAAVLWAYHVRSEQVRVFEVNTLGVADLHVGGFNPDGTLTLELRDQSTGRVMQRRRFALETDKMVIDAWFFDGEAEVHHTSTLVRQN